MATGWNDGLCQDYDKGLGRWFADRLGARQQLRQDFEMTQHITQEVAETIRESCYGQSNLSEFYRAMMNAAIQHYLDQNKAELPVLPDTYGSVEEQIVERYRVGKTQGGFWPSCVKAGDGNMDVFVGSTKQAENVRQALQTACLDGAFIASQKAKEQYKDFGQQCAAQARELALSEAIAICRRNAQNTSADELEALKGEVK